MALGHNVYTTKDNQIVIGDTNIIETLLRGNVILQADNQKLLFGAGDDSSIYYDGIDMIINPQEVGDGILKVLGDLNQTNGDSTINNIYGGMYMLNETGMDSTFNSTYQKLYFDSSDYLNGFSFLDSTLMLTKGDGLYQVMWKAEGTGTNNHLYNGYVYINDVQYNSTKGRTLGTGNSEVKMSGFGFVRINQYDNITVKVADTTSSSIGTQIDANLNLVRVGN